MESVSWGQLLAAVQAGARNRSRNWSWSICGQGNLVGQGVATAVGQGVGFVDGLEVGEGIGSAVGQRVGKQFSWTSSWLAKVMGHWWG